MSYLNVLEKASIPDRWMLLKYSKDFVEPDSALLILKLYAVRFVATFLAIVAWVTFTLITGIFTVSMVPLLGVVIGSAHVLLRQKPHRFHLISGLLLTVASGTFGSIFAGLALFSSKMGVSYWHVLVATFTPDNMEVLSGVFLQSILPNDILYYMAASTAVIFFAQHCYFYGLSTSKKIETQLINGKVCHLRPSALNTLLSLGRVVQFKRSNGWTVVGLDPLRSMNETVTYTGLDRRLSS